MANEPSQPCALHSTLVADAKEYQERLRGVDLSLIGLTGKIQELKERFDRHGNEVRDVARALAEYIQRTDKLLFSDVDKPGLIARVENHDEWIKDKKRNISSMINVVYKVVMTAMVTSLLVKVGF